jgi:hypothetical protein
MRRNLLLGAVFSVICSLSGQANAGPMMGTIDLTIGPDVARLARTAYSSGLVDLSNLPQNLPLPGPSLGYNNNGWFDETINTTFDLKITFSGASGVSPSVDLTGRLVGEIGGTEATENLGGFFAATPTSAALNNWSVDSGVPLTLIDQYLNPSSYHLDGAIEGGSENHAGFLMTVDSSSGIVSVPAPEPAAVVVFLAAFAALGVRVGALRRFIASPRSH